MCGVHLLIAQAKLIRLASKAGRIIGILFHIFQVSSSGAGLKLALVLAEGENLHDGLCPFEEKPFNAIKFSSKLTS